LVTCIGTGPAVVGNIAEADHSTDTFVVSFGGQSQVLVASELVRVGNADGQCRAPPGHTAEGSSSCQSDAIPSWDTIPVQKIRVYRCARVQSFRELCCGASPSSTLQFSHENALLQSGPAVFAAGQKQSVSHALLNGERPMVAKHPRAPRPSPTDASDPSEALATLKLARSEISQVAAFLAEQFSAGQEHGSRITFLESRSAILRSKTQRQNDSGAAFNLEDPLPPGDFQHFSNRIGWWLAAADRVLKCFSRWTYDVTDGHLMVVNLQGVPTDSGWTLTDPCILCTDGARFGSGNLGSRAMQCCVVSLKAALGDVSSDKHSGPPPEPKKTPAREMIGDKSNAVGATGSSSSSVAPDCSTPRSRATASSSSANVDGTRGTGSESSGTLLDQLIVESAPASSSADRSTASAASKAMQKIARAPRRAATAFLSMAICRGMGCKSLPASVSEPSAPGSAVPGRPQFKTQRSAGSTPIAAQSAPRPELPHLMPRANSTGSGSSKDSKASSLWRKTASTSTTLEPEAAQLDLEQVLSGLLVPSKSALTGAQLPSEEIAQVLILAARPIFMSQPSLLELDAPVKVLGDIHGQFKDLLYFFELGGLPPESNYLLLGDYVDRGKQSLETILLLLALKLKHPENLFLLRGNHECASITRVYGFYDECKRRYSLKLWKVFCDVFNCLPPAAVIGSKIFCCHGGPSPDIACFDDISCIRRPADIPDGGVLCDLLWADPESELEGWVENDRGISYRFGADVVRGFCERLDLDLIVRAHQVVEDGYEFFAKRALVTVFSAPNYCGEFDNSAAMLCVEKNLGCRFKVVQADVRKNT